MSEDKIIIDLDEDDVIEVPEGAARKKTMRILAFALGQENYCVALDQAKEVVRSANITRIPNSPDFVVGVTNLRGEIVSILDIRHFFGLGDQEKTRDFRILITDATGPNIGIMVDKVKAIVEIEEDAIQPPLATIKGKLADYTKGEIQLGNDILVLLDLEKVLNNEMINDLRKGVS